MKLNIVLLLCSIFVTSVTYAGFPVNVNTATAEEIAEGLDGIGLKKAQAIVEYRSHSGVYRSTDDLLNVKGIGEKTIEKNRSYVILTQDSGEELNQAD